VNKKTACVVLDRYTQTKAVQYCKKFGLNLFQIDSEKTQKALAKYFTRELSFLPLLLRIDGLRDEVDGKWYFYNNGKQPAFEGLNWMFTNDTLTGDNSLVVTNFAYPFLKYKPSVRIDGMSASEKLYVLCEAT